MRKFKLSLIATGVGAALAMALSGPVLAEGGGGWPGPSGATGNTIKHVSGSAVATDDASASYVDLGDVSVTAYSANTTLNGTVKNNGSEGIQGNNGGAAGAAGSGGVGNNGSAGAIAGSGAFGADGGSGGDVGKGDGNWGGTGGAAAGAVSSGALALAATGNGAMGGWGGSANGGSAGNFVVSNSIANNSFASAAGIMNVSQNTGSNALNQQGVTVQGNVSF